MKNLCISIGNSDNKLTQKEWSDFCHDFYMVCDTIKEVMHFQGFSASSSPFQNCTIIIQIKNENLDLLVERLGELKKEYKQDSIAVIMSSESLFI